MLRTQGVEGTAIPAVMGEAGLTHGGFYAHFRNKTELLAEVCATSLRRTSDKLAAAAQRDKPQEELANFIDDYLNVEKRDDKATACILPAVAAEIERQEPEVRHALSGATAEYVQSIAALLPGANQQEREDRAWILASGLSGALLLARTVDDPQLSERILATTREFYKSNFAQ